MLEVPGQEFSPLSLSLVTMPRRPPGKTYSRLDAMADWDFPVKASAFDETTLNLPDDVATMDDGCFPYTSEYAWTFRYFFTGGLVNSTCIFMVAGLRGAPGDTSMVPGGLGAAEDSRPCWRVIADTGTASAPSSSSLA